MGNRAIIKTESGNIGLYLHWNGGRDSVEPFLAYCKLRGHRSPELDGYGWARLAQVVGNFFGGSLSVGIVNADDESGEGCDNGVYIIRNWEIVRREHFCGIEQAEYDFNEMLLAIDEAQPAADQIGEYLRAEEVKASELKKGDTVVFLSTIDGKVEKGVVIGFGPAGKICNGSSVEGKPYIDRYGNGNPENNINNYILTDTARRAAADTIQLAEAEKSPVEIFINDNLNGIELKFSRKPSDAIREELKNKGFRWHFKKCVWYAKRSPERLELARSIAAELVK